jgi:serine/threonine protein kinase
MSRRRSVKIEDVVKVSVLGEGSQGIVWSAKLRNSRKKRADFALKYRLVKRRDADMRDTKTSSVLRELEFYHKVANRHPNLFSKLYDWSLIPASQEIKDRFVSGDKISKESLQRYTHVFITLSSKKEGVLKSVVETLDKGQWLSMLAQICYALSVLHERGFSHGDAWEANIAYDRIPVREVVHLGRNPVPSFGYQWSLIDYGSSELKADETTGVKAGKRYDSYELDDLISLVSGQSAADDYCSTSAHEEDMESKGFSAKVLKSVDGPSVRNIMKITGLSLGQSLALLSLDAYVWHVCDEIKPDEVKPKINRGMLLDMSRAHVSYAKLSQSFAQLARRGVK